MTKEDFKVGQTVYLLQILNYRNNATAEERIREVKVVSVGRKYITVDFWGKVKFDSTDNFKEVTVYSPSYALYLSKEQILQDIHKEQMIKDVYSSFNFGLVRRMSHEDLQTVFDIMKKYKDGDKQC